MTDRINPALLAIRKDEMIALAYRRLRKPLSGYVARHIGDCPDVEDMVQDTFESLLKPGRMLSESTLDRYVYSIAHNLIIDWYRRHACSIRAKDYFFAHPPLFAEDADVKVQVDDIMHIEASALRKVSDNARRAYLMSVHCGNNVRDIAEQMHLSARSVENHIFKTRRYVREAIRTAL